MSLYIDNSEPTLRMILRDVPVLAPEDSIESFLRAIRAQPFSDAPIQRDGKLCGVVSLEDVVAAIPTNDAASRATALRRPLSDLMREASCVADAGMTVTEVGALCAGARRTIVPVADEHGVLLGVVLAADILAPAFTPCYPQRVGGMATPFGVYLTNGSVRGGVGDHALVATGMTISVLSLLSAAAVKLMISAASGIFPVLRSPAFTLDALDGASHRLDVGLASLAASLVMVLVFLVALRSTRLAKYHAAEHQTVHAMERNEALVPEIVGRMPRAHPRCGTNLVAAGIIFMTGQRVLALVPWLDEMSASMVAAVAAALLWRRFGAFIQERFTTRPGGERELMSGIAAATALTKAYYRCPPRRARGLRRIWCSGLPQTAFGMMLVWSIAAIVLRPWLP